MITQASANAKSPYSKAELTAHLREGKLTPEALFQLYVIQTRASFFEQRVHGAVEEMQFRGDLARAMGLSINEVLLVGSAQLGFSIKPGARLRPFDDTFRQSNLLRDKSDVDVAIVSAPYFDFIHRAAYKHTSKFTLSWEYNVYYRDSSSMQHLRFQRVDANFYWYLARGWIRPDFLPSDFKLAWESALIEWRKRLNRKVALGIYREWSILKDYQIESFEILKQAALKGQI